MPNRKALPADIADRFFQGKSVFFGDLPQAPPSSTPQSKAVTEESAAPMPPLQTPPSAASYPSSMQDHPPNSNQQALQATLPSIRQDVTTDVMTSILQDVDLKEWREQIENTVTQNSSLRLTSEERYVIEDMIHELQRQEKIKTSMNEVARLGLLFLIHEFKKNRRTSIIYRVKKA